MTLFQTNAWQSAWWETWGVSKDFRLINPWDGESSGIYLSKYRWKKILPIRSLQFVGTSARQIQTPRTEHNRFIRQTGESLHMSIESVLDKESWTEAVFSDLKSDSEDLRELLGIAGKRNWVVRLAASDAGYAVATEGDFRDYLAGLGSNTRLRLYNRRKVLEAKGVVRHQNFWPDQPSVFFDALNEFHRARWGKACLDPRSQAFHEAFLARVGVEGGEPLLTGLYCGDRLVSVLYNVWYQGVVYNIQAGFEQQFHKKLALGSLHLGYAIEQSFKSPNTIRFDMLAGQGQNEDYKARFATETYYLNSIMLVKNRLFRLLYGLKGALEKVTNA